VVLLDKLFRWYETFKVIEKTEDNELKIQCEEELRNIKLKGKQLFSDYDIDKKNASDEK